MAANCEHDNSQSSMLKLPPDFRRMVDIHIVERVPPTYQGVWMQFKLGEKGVTFSSFYRYARRLRDRANLAEMAALTDDQPGQLDEPIRKLLYRRLLEVLLHTESVSAVKEISSLLAALQRSEAAALQKCVRSDEARIAWARLEQERDSLRIKSEHQLAVRRRFESRERAALPPAEPAEPPVG